MKYMRRTAGYTWTDYKTNAQMMMMMIIIIIIITNIGKRTIHKEKR